MVFVLYNTHAGAHFGEDKLRSKMKTFFPNEEISYTDTITVENKQSFVDNLTPKDSLVVVGGDGTLNRFVNGIEDRDYPFDIFCYAAGTGNDFVNDVAGVKTDEMIRINDYIKELPVIEVNGNSYKFINGMGCGIDGYCCAVGDEHRRRKNGKSPSYTAIAFKGLLYAFKTLNAEVTVDGVTKSYKNVWMVPSMNGRYFGGGVKITPGQDRLNKERTISVAVVACKSRLKLLTVFPRIFKGTHTKFTDLFILNPNAKQVHVKFDRPTDLQIDGEPLLNVTEYKVRSAACAKQPAPV